MTVIQFGGDAWNVQWRTQVYNVRWHIHSPGVPDTVAKWHDPKCLCNGCTGKNITVTGDIKVGNMSANTGRGEQAETSTESRQRLQKK